MPLLAPPVHAAGAEQADVATSIVDALQRLGGPKTGLRKAHPKGVCFSGSFMPDAASAASVTRSPAYTAKAAYSVIGRFSQAGPNPAAADNTHDGRGLAVRLAPDGDNRMDLVLVSTPMFPAANPKDFLELLQAVGPDPATGKPDQARLDAYLAAHPAVGRQAAWQKSHPVYASYAATPYFGIHAFRFTNAQGQSIKGKIVAEPVGGAVGLDDDEAKARGADFLQSELAAHVAKQPAAIDIFVQIGEAADPTDNPSVAWPDERRKVHLGRLSIEKATGQECAGELFMPTTLTTGVEPIDDPLLSVRAQAYAVSFGRRVSGQ
ncbi:MAG: catalase family peroxidase [Pseudomonadota bacterium]|nr:catalase family peroxidase [Pseudomonadota bacterium]